MTVLPTNPSAMPANWLIAKKVPPRRRAPPERPVRPACACAVPEAGGGAATGAAAASTGDIAVAPQLGAGDPFHRADLIGGHLGPPALVEPDLGGPGEPHAGAGG